MDPADDDVPRATSGPLAQRSILLAGTVAAVAVAVSLAVIAGLAERDLAWPTVPLVVLGATLGALPLLWARSRPLLVAAATPLVHVLGAVLGVVIEGLPTAAVANSAWELNLENDLDLGQGFDAGYDAGFNAGYDVGYLIGRAHRTALDGLLPESFAELTSGAAMTFLLAMPLIVYLVARLRPVLSVVAALTVQTVPMLVTGGLLSGFGLPRLALVVATAMAGVTVALAPVWVVGVLRRRRAVGAEARAARYRTLAAQAVRDERSRIARELQTLVLADLTTIGDRAEAAHHDSATDDDVRDALLTITGTGRDTLTAMRRLLGMLRATAGTGTAVAEPQPTLDRLDDLVGEFRRGGMEVGVTVSGSRRPLAAEVDLAAYRLVQETLTGAGRAEPVELVLTYDADGVRITATGDLAATGGVAAREWVRLVGGRLRRGRGSAPTLDVHLPDRARESA